MKKILIAVFAALVTAAWVLPVMAADVKIGGELRERGIWVDNEKQTDGAQARDVKYIEQRLRLNVDAELESNVKVFVSLQDSRNWGDEGSTATTGNDAQAVDLSQAYVVFSNILDQPLSIKVGRQVLAYGEHRLIGSFEWSNNARRFDAIKLSYNHEVFNVDLWTAKVDEGGTTTTTSTTGFGQKDLDFNGIYATVKAIPMNTLDLYYFQDRDGATTVKRDVRTMGARLNGGAINIDWTAEYAKQGGRSSMSSTEVETKQDSNAYAIKAGYTIPQAVNLRIGAEYDKATGDKAGTTDKNEAFRNLYPTNHPLYGFTDDITWSDMKAWSINVGIKPMDNLKVAAEYWKYKADEVASGQSDDLGKEINVKANYNITKNTSLEVAYAIRDAGNAGDSGFPKDYAGRAIPKNEDATFAYLMLDVKF
ncbi:MAG: alginate export family protein [Deltaproteobacteria bacterium]|nr:alginate export family protein [Deltaproteobacteria bacterium]